MSAWLVAGSSVAAITVGVAAGCLVDHVSWRLAEGRRRQRRRRCGGYVSEVTRGA